MAIKDYSTDPDLNVQISGINIAEGCPPSGINNAIRQLMADVKEESEAKVDKDAEQDEAIANKAATDLSNLSETGKSLAAGLGMPSEKTVNFTVGASGTNYTAPATGWFYAEASSAASGNTGSFLYLMKDGGIKSQITLNPVNASNISVFIPVQKGSTVRLGYFGTLTVNVLRFYYAEGEES